MICWRLPITLTPDRSAPLLRDIAEHMAAHAVITVELGMAVGEVRATPHFGECRIYGDWPLRGIAAMAGTVWDRLRDRSPIDYPRAISHDKIRVLPHLSLRDTMHMERAAIRLLDPNDDRAGDLRLRIAAIELVADHLIGGDSLHTRAVKEIMTSFIGAE